MFSRTPFLGWTLYVRDVNMCPLRMQAVFLAATADKHLIIAVTLMRDRRDRVSETSFARCLIDEAVGTAITNDIHLVERCDNPRIRECRHRLDTDALHVALLT